jgi:hypothetical protein
MDVPATSGVGSGRARALLAGAWEGIEGGFRTESLISRGGLLYLGLSGPIETLSRAIAALLPRLGLETARAPLEPGLGFFLCRPDGPGGALDAALALDPPALTFAVCSLSLYRLDLGDEAFSAAAWREVASAVRPGSTGRGEQRGR